MAINEYPSRASSMKIIGKTVSSPHSLSCSFQLLLLLSFTLSIPKWRMMPYLQFRRCLVTRNLERLVVTKSVIKDPNRVGDFGDISLTVFRYRYQSGLRFLFNHVYCYRHPASSPNKSTLSIIITFAKITSATNIMTCSKSLNLPLLYHFCMITHDLL